jgi:hypothetical protein
MQYKPKNIPAGMDLKARLGFLLDNLLPLNLRGPSCQSQKQRI